MKEKEIYKGIIFDLVQKEVEIKGKTYLRDIIRHPGGVGVLAVQDGKILLVRQYRHAIGKETLEIPAGKLEYGENPRTCGLRELNEETGYECDEFVELPSLVSTPGFCDERIWLYQAKGLKKAENKLDLDEDEEIDMIWLSLEEAYNKMMNKEIDDAKTVIALQHAIIEHMKGK